MVVLMSNCPETETVANMSRHMLLATAIVRRYFAFHGRARLRYIPRILVRARMKTLTKICNRLTTEQLVDECTMLMESLRKLLPPFRFNLLYTPNVTDIACQLTTSILYGISSYKSWTEKREEPTE